MEEIEWVLTYQPAGTERAVFERFADEFGAMDRVNALSNADNADRAVGVETTYTVWHGDSIFFQGSHIPSIKNRYGSDDEPWE